MEYTGFELQPLDVFFYADEEPLNIKDLFKMVMEDSANVDLNEHVSFSSFFDIMSVKFYKISYPSFCTFDLGNLISSGQFIECGYDHK